MPKLTINDISVDAVEGMTVLQACEQAGIEIPVFCYHPRLSIAGNCRMCLVELEKSPKPVASCAMPVAEGMVVRTNTPMVEKARKGVLEFLLINHPLDCPICDQGGECDLQDITYNYSRGHSRFDLNKRAVTDKNMGPLIKTVMTRCIHCTRCIRFSDEIAGVSELGTLGRGEHMEITPYLERSITSELSGNLIDVCPVGALTSKPYAFHGRPWELTKTESIDAMDAVGSSIRIDTRGQEVLRILPRLNEEINEEWIHDKTRFSYDGLKRQRLDKPYIRVNGKLKSCSWAEAFEAIHQKITSINPLEMAALAGDSVDCESMLLLKELMTSLHVPHLDCRQDGAHLDPTNRCSYLFNTTIAGLEEADLILLVATNPRHEAPLINARIRKRYLKGGLTVALVGAEAKLTYPYQFLGDQAPILKEILEGTHPFAEELKKAKKPAVIIGQGALVRRDGGEILRLCQMMAEKYKMIQSDWNGFNVLHTAAARVGGLDLEFTPDIAHQGLDTAGILSACQSGKIKLIYLLGVDEIPMSQFGDAFVIYQGHHGDAGAHRADVVLPGAAYTEKTATYVNTEGRPQQTECALSPPGDAKEDWRIIRALSEALGKTLPYTTWEDVQKRLTETKSIFASKNRIIPAEWRILEDKKPETLSQLPFRPIIDNFYMTDPISRHSATMAQCTTTILVNQEEKLPHD